MKNWLNLLWKHVYAKGYLAGARDEHALHTSGFDGNAARDEETGALLANGRGVGGQVWSR